MNYIKYKSYKLNHIKDIVYNIYFVKYRLYDIKYIIYNVYNK